jgi:hypothetical protein
VTVSFLAKSLLSTVGKGTAEFLHWSLSDFICDTSSNLTSGWMDGSVGEWMEGWMNGRVGGWVGGCVVGRMDDLMNGWVSG